MKKFFTVLSGLYLTGVGLLSGLLLILSYFFVAQSGAQQIQAANFVFSAIINLVLGSAVVVTGIGIILRKNWARYALFVLSGFAIFTGLIMSIFIIFMPLPVDSTATAQTMPLVKTSFLIFASVFFLAIPVFFFIFFSRKSVKELFTAKKEKAIIKQAGRPLGITLIASLMLFGAITMVLLALFPTSEKMPLVDVIFISGMLARVYFFSFAIVSLYIAIGLYKLKKGAWIGYVVFSLYGIVVSVINIFTFTKDTFIETMPQLAENPYSMPVGLFKVPIAASVILSIALLWYIYSRKKYFFGTID